MEGTILQEIMRNCRECEERLVYAWINEDCDVTRVVSYRELGEETRKIAEELVRSPEPRRGERAILCYPPGLDFIVSFIACLRAGITAGIYIFLCCNVARCPLRPCMQHVVHGLVTKQNTTYKPYMVLNNQLYTTSSRLTTPPNTLLPNPSPPSHFVQFQWSLRPSVMPILQLH